MVEHRQGPPAAIGDGLPCRAGKEGARKSPDLGAPRRIGRFAWAGCRVVLGVAAMILICGGLLAARLAQGPINLEDLGPKIAGSLDERFGRGYHFSLGEISIVNRDYRPTLNIDGFSVKDASGQTVLTAPRAEVSVDLLALTIGRVTAKRLEVFDVELHLALRPDGSLAMPAGAKLDALSAKSDSPTPAPPLAASASGGAPARTGAGEGANAPAQTPAQDRAASGAVAAPPQDAAASAPAPPDASASGKAATPGSPPPPALVVKQIASGIRLLIDTLTNPTSPIAAVDRVGIARGRIVVDDEMTGQAVVFNGVNLGFDKTFAGREFSLAVDGPNGRWTVAGLAAGAPGGDRRLMLSMQNFSLDEILLATGARSAGADFDMPLSAKLALGLTADGKLSEARGEFDFGAGYLRFDDPNDEPMMVDQIRGGFHWDGAKRRILIEGLSLSSGETHGAAKGFVALPVHQGDPWTIALVNAAPVVAAPEWPGQTPVRIDRGELRARLFPEQKTLVLDRFAFSGPECSIAVAGGVDWTHGPHLRMGASSGRSPISVITRIWPSFMTPPVRNWLISHANEGIIEKAALRVDFDAATIAAMRAEHPPPDDSVLLDFVVSKGSVEFLTGAPRLREIDGVGHVTGRTSTFTLTNAASVEASPGRTLTLLEGGSFHIANSELKPTPAVISVNASGSVEAAADLLSLDALKPYANLPLDKSALRGQLDGALEIDLLLGPHMGPGDVALKINAAVTNFSADNLIGKEKLDAATLNLTFDPTGLRASGQGRIFGTVATLDVAHPKGKPAEATIKMTLDDAARARQGFAAIPGLSGPVGVSITAPLGAGDKPKAEIELDLTHAAFDLTGVVKPAGRPGKAKFTLTVNDNSALLDPFVLEAGSIQARGVVELGADQSLRSFRFPMMKISPGDEMKVDAVKIGDSLQFTVRASAIDATPFLKWLVASSPDRAGASASGADRKEVGAINEIGFDIRSGVVSGYNRQVVSGAEMSLTRRNDQLSQFTFAGRFGREPLSANLVGGSAAPQINLMTGDAGSLLSFFDFYKHMERGNMSVNMRLGGGGPSGVLVIDSFILRDEPALRRLVDEGVPQSPEGSARRAKIDAGAMGFTRLQTRFQRAGSRLDVSDGTMFGDAIGLTVEGWLDYARDRVDVKGTFVPAFAVNNLFSKIPLFGMILGGGTNEGLFGVNYRIEGAITAPTLTVNPLSAIAPGILRQIFGVGGEIGAH